MANITLLDLLANGKQELARKAATAKLRRPGQVTPGIDINALARQIEAELLWRSTHLVTIFNEQQCTECGAINTALQGVMVEQEHIRESGARRMLRSVENHPALPRKHEVWIEHVSCCKECYTDEHALPVITPLSIPERRDTEEIQS